MADTKEMVPEACRAVTQRLGMKYQYTHEEK